MTKALTENRLSLLPVWETREESSQGEQMWMVIWGWNVMVGGMWRGVMHGIWEIWGRGKIGVKDSE